jgi:hypothetical protein
MNGEMRGIGGRGGNPLLRRGMSLLVAWGYFVGEGLSLDVAGSAGEKGEVRRVNYENREKGKGGYHGDAETRGSWVWDAGGHGFSRGFLGWGKPGTLMFANAC